jgi:hypothetical protein
VRHDLFIKVLRHHADHRATKGALPRTQRKIRLSVGQTQRLTGLDDATPVRKYQECEIGALACFLIVGLAAIAAAHEKDLTNDAQILE